jgi:hypothetical protein
MFGEDSLDFLCALGMPSLGEECTPAPSRSDGSIRIGAGNGSIEGEVVGLFPELAGDIFGLLPVLAGDAADISGVVGHEPVPPALVQLVGRLAKKALNSSQLTILSSLVSISWKRRSMASREPSS